MPDRAPTLASMVLNRFNVTSPPVPDGIIHFGGVHIWTRLTQLPGRIGGALYCELPYGAVIWLQASDPPGRRRFTLFHEYGHLLMHPGVFYCQAQSESQHEREFEADRFAVEILMPADWIRRDAREYGTTHLAQRFRVSQQAMSIRLQELGVTQ